MKVNLKVNLVGLFLFCLLLGVPYSSYGIDQEKCPGILVPQTHQQNDFDDTLAPDGLGDPRKYSVGLDGEADPYRLPLVKFVLDLNISNTRFGDNDNQSLSSGIDLRTLISPLFFQLLSQSTATARFYAMRVIALRWEQKFIDNSIREALYKTIWDDRMDPNLGINSIRDCSLFDTAIEGRDPILLRFIVEKPNFNLITSKPLEKLIEAEQFQSATMILKKFENIIPSADIADAISQMAYGVESFNTQAADIFEDVTWKKAISKIGGDDWDHKKYIMSGGFPMPLLFAAVNLNFNLAFAILKAGIKNLIAPATFAPSYIASLVYVRTSPSINQEYRWTDEKIERLEKLFSVKANTKVEFLRDTVQFKIGEEIYNVKEGKLLDSVIGPISISEILHYFLGFKIDYLESISN